ncbi:MAG: ABC transporter permease [Anaerosacchariphilus sp.]
MDIRCVFTWWLVLGSVLFAGIVALIAAWIPARKAMNISPNGDPKRISGRCGSMGKSEKDNTREKEQRLGRGTAEPDG